MKTSLLLFFLVLFTACTKGKPSPVNGPGQTQTLKDIPYGNDALQKMDIYLPAGRSTTSTKTIVIIHGGGWSGGDKKDMAIIADSIRKRLPGYALININYRLAYNNTVNLFPTQEEDIKKAIAFYLDESAKYQVSTDLVLVGASAGGHLALLHACKNDPDRHVKAVIDYFGPTDLARLWNAGFSQQLILVSVIGKSYDQDPAPYVQSSPLHFITPQSPPTIAIQGGLDLLVPADQSQLLVDQLTGKGVPAQLVLYPTGGHGNWPLETYSDSFEKIQAFIATHVP